MMMSFLAHVDIDIGTLQHVRWDSLLLAVSPLFLLFARTDLATIVAI